MWALTTQGSSHFLNVCSMWVKSWLAIVPLLKGSEEVSISIEGPVNSFKYFYADEDSDKDAHTILTSVEISMWAYVLMYCM